MWANIFRIGTEFCQFWPKLASIGRNNLCPGGAGPSQGEARLLGRLAGNLWAASDLAGFARVKLRRA